MKISGKGEYDLMSKTGRSEVISYIKGKRALQIPTITEMLVGKTRVFESCHEGINSLGYTCFNPRTAFFEIYLNFKRMSEEGITENQFEFVVWHEFLHNFIFHFLRKKIRDFSKLNNDLCNILEDIIINEYIIKFLGILDNETNKWIRANFNTYDTLNLIFKPEVIDFQMTELTSVDHLIDLCEKNLEKISVPRYFAVGDHGMSMNISSGHDADTEGVEEGGQNQNSFRNKDDQIDPNVRVDSTFTEDMAKQVIQETYNRAKMRGTNISESEERLFKVSLQKRTCFDSIKFKNLVKGMAGIFSIRTYHKIHRHKEYFTGIPYMGKKFSTPPEVWIAIDTSGSINENELEFMISTTMTFAKNKKAKVNIIVWSSDINNVYTDIKKFTDIPKLKFGSTGGTCVNLVFDYIAKKIEETNKRAACIVLTDGYISQEKYHEDMDLYFGLTNKTEEQVRTMYPDAKQISVLKYDM